MLSSADGRSAPDEVEVLRLSSLSWFRQGWVPGELRRALLALQSPQDRAVTRQALVEIGWAAADATNVGPYGQVVVRQIGSAPRFWRGDWESRRAAQPKFSVERDKILSSYMTTPIGRLVRNYYFVFAIASVASGIGYFAVLEWGKSL
jgi:hypothetical protein